MVQSLDGDKIKDMGNCGGGGNDKLGRGGEEGERELFIS